MKKNITYVLIALALIGYIKFGTANNWEGKNFQEIFFFVDPSIREKKTQEQFLQHAGDIRVNVMYQNGTSENILIEPYASIYFNQYPELKMVQYHPPFSGASDTQLICTNWDVKVDGVRVERYDAIASGITRFKILK